MMCVCEIYIVLFSVQKERMRHEHWKLLWLLASTSWYASFREIKLRFRIQLPSNFAAERMSLLILRHKCTKFGIQLPSNFAAIGMQVLETRSETKKNSSVKDMVRNRAIIYVEINPWFVSFCAKQIEYIITSFCDCLLPPVVMQVLEISAGSNNISILFS